MTHQKASAGREMLAQASNVPGGTRTIPATEALRWTGMELFQMEKVDHRPLRLAILSAVALHALFFGWNIWPKAKQLDLPVEEGHCLVLVKIKPPEKTPEPRKPQPPVERATRIPVPDLTPDELEPVVAVVPEVEYPPEDQPAWYPGDIVVEPGEPPASDEPIHSIHATRIPEITYRHPPEYPEIARRARVQGLVILEAIIDKDGSVRDVRVLSSASRLLEGAAMDALRQWRFRPGEMNGRPVAVIMTLKVQFKLDK